MGMGNWDFIYTHPGSSHNFLRRRGVIPKYSESGIIMVTDGDFLEVIVIYPLKWMCLNIGQSMLESKLWQYFLRYSSGNILGYIPTLTIP